MPGVPKSLVILGFRRQRGMRNVFENRFRPLQTAAAGSMFAMIVASCAGQPAPDNFAAPAGRPQGGVSVLELLDTGGRQLTVGSVEMGTLSDADYRSADESFLEAWSLQAAAGTRVTVDLIATDFDPYVYVIGPGLGETLRDDDSGNGCEARLTFTVLEPGPYRVIASTLGADRMGSYRLSVSEGVPAAPTHNCGDFDPEFLSSLPTDGRRLDLGSVANGRLSAGGVTMDGNKPVEAWLLRGRAGESVMVRLESDAFDAKMYIGGPGLDEILSDDDGGGDLNSQLTVHFAEDGDYIVVASALSEGSSGAYTIRVEEPMDLNTISTDGRFAVFGDAVGGFLSEEDPIVIDGRRGQAWELEGNVGQSVTVELTSDDFDSYLYIVGPGLNEPLSDDDSAGELNSRISFSFPETGIYRIIVSALTSSSTGAFELRVRRGM